MSMAADSQVFHPTPHMVKQFDKTVSSDRQSRACRVHIMASSTFTSLRRMEPEVAYPCTTLGDITDSLCKPLLHTV